MEGKGLALSIAGLYQYTHYGCEHVRGERKFTAGKRDLTPFLETGRRLMPSRYRTKDSQIDTFEWFLPSDEYLDLIR